MSLRSTLVLAVLLGASLSLLAQSTYSNVVLTDPPRSGGSFEGAAMNQSGMSVVNVPYPGCDDNYNRPVAYDKNGNVIGTFAALAPDPNSSDPYNPCPTFPSATANAIDSNGDFVGTSDALDAQGNPTTDAYLVKNGVMTDLNTLVTGGDTTAHLTVATTMNNVGQVAGLIGSSNNTGFLFDNGTVTNLGSFKPVSMNDLGAIVGYDANTHEVEVYKAGSLTDVGVVAAAYGGSYLLSINSSGHVAGLTGDSSGNVAFYWDGSAVTNVAELIWGVVSNLNDYDQLSYVVSDTTGTNTTYLWSPSAGAQGISSQLTAAGDWFIPIVMNNAGQLLVQPPDSPAGNTYYVFTPAATATAVSTSSEQVQSGGLTLDFTNGVQTSGTTTVSSVDPSTITSVPSGFTAAGSGYEIQTTAGVTFPATVSFTVPGPMSQADFDSVQIAHYINGGIDPNCCTVVARNYDTLTITIQTNSFSPFLPVRKIPPKFTAIGDITQEATAAAGNQVSYSVTATDASGASATVVCSPDSGALFPIASTRVGCQATDAQGLTANASFNVIVRDTTPPVLQLPASPLVVPLAGPDGTVVNFTASATDNIDGPLNSPYFMCDHDPGSTFPAGTTVVTCTAVDHHNNQATGSFQVVVGGPANVALAEFYIKNGGALKTGDTIQYAIGVGNLGPNAASGTTLTDQLPSGVNFESASSSLCSVSGQTVTCAIGQLPVNGTFVLLLTGQVTAPKNTTLVNTATVAAANPDPNPANNSASVSTTVH